MNGEETSSVLEIIDVPEVLNRPTFGEPEIALLSDAVSHEQYADVRQAINDLLSAIDAGDSSPQQLLRAGIVGRLLGWHDVAVSCLSRIPNDGFAEFHLANSHVALGNYDEAAKCFEQAASHGYDQVECTLRRAGTVRAAGRLDEAEDLLKAASREGATRAEYSYQFGCIFSDRGDSAGAIEYFERAVDMDSHHSRALFSLAGENNLQGNDSEAIRLYERALSKPPLYLGALINLGLLYEDNENYRAAAYCFRQVVSTYPDHERARLYLRDIEAAEDMYFDEDTVKEQGRLDQLLSTPVTDFELSVRSRNCLQKMGVRDLGDLTRLSEQELLSGKNFGETSLDEIKEMMESKGLALGQSAQTGPPKDYGYRNEDLSPQEQALLGRTVADLNLSVRARKCMGKLAVTTLGELIHRSQDDLLESKNFGVTSLNEVRRKLADLGLKLRGD